MSGLATYPPGASPAEFASLGFALVADVLSEAECDALAANVGRAEPGTAGTRCLLSQAWCREFAMRLRHHPALAGLIPASHVAVQCTSFEKSTSRNWLVPAHQDLSIPVARRIDHPALRGWSEKEGAMFVQAPEALLRQLLAVRVHLDRCEATDGPLRVVPGSHHALVDEEETAAMRRAGPEFVCTGERGSALVMRPLLLHASSKATGSSLRRVLHLVFGPAVLPYGLQWHHAV